MRDVSVNYTSERHVFPGSVSSRNSGSGIDSWAQARKYHRGDKDIDKNMLLFVAGEEQSQENIILQGHPWRNMSE